MTALRTLQFEALDPGSAGLIVIDVQRSFADPAFLDPAGLTEDDAAAVARSIERCAILVANARLRGVPVYWVELATPADAPWRASMWLRAGDPDAAITGDEPCVIGTPGAEWYGVAPAAGEARFPKRGYSGFQGTDLADRLRADGVEWVTVAGLTTECCVAATATDAFQAGWPVLVAEDATAAYTAEIHSAAVTTLALNVAVISTVDEIDGVWAHRPDLGEVAA